MTNNRETDTVKAFYGSLVGGGEKLITAATSHTIINVLLCLEKCSSFRAFDVQFILSTKHTSLWEKNRLFITPDPDSNIKPVKGNLPENTFHLNFIF